MNELERVINDCPMTNDALEAIKRENGRIDVGSVVWSKYKDELQELHQAGIIYRVGRSYLLPREGACEFF